jgi:hypothetical protein
MEEVKTELTSNGGDPVYRIDMKKVMECHNPFKKINAMFRIIFLLGLDFRQVDTKEPIYDFLSVNRYEDLPKPIQLPMKDHLSKKGKKQS